MSDFLINSADKKTAEINFFNCMSTLRKITTGEIIGDLQVNEILKQAGVKK